MLMLKIPPPPRPGAGRIQSAAVDDDWITLVLADGRSLRLPTAFSTPLYLAGERERRRWRISARGRLIRWPELGVVVGVDLRRG